MLIPCFIGKEVVIGPVSETRAGVLIPILRKIPLGWKSLCSLHGMLPLPFPAVHMECATLLSPGTQILQGYVLGMTPGSSLSKISHFLCHVLDFSQDDFKASSIFSFKNEGQNRNKCRIV